jgi:hypothetical protein
LIEVRGVGLLPMPVVEDVPVALLLRLTRDAPRYVEEAPRAMVMGAFLPVIALWPDSPVLALRAQMALEHHGLP